jgi:predicted alpha/beta-fold hydrolase
MLRPFVPHPRIRGGHWMTLFAWGRPRYFPRLPPPVTRYFDVAPDARVMARCHWRPRPWTHPTLLLLHGLEGSSDAHYMCGIADKAVAAEFNVVRLNQRNCGGTEALSRTLYHSGLTQDPLTVVRELIDVDGLPAIVIAGYSLGGNLTLKLAGELGEAPPPALKAVCAVSPTLDLARCVDALERRENALYELNFMRGLRARMRRKAEMFPQIFDARGIGRVRTVREFDERYTAPHFGFAGATDYYHRASSIRVVDRIRVPALVITADDDPFVPPDQFLVDEVTGNPAITLAITRGGGHCAFVSERHGQDDGYWAERTIVEFATRALSPRREPRVPVSR